MLRTCDDFVPTNLHERDCLGVARFEPNRGPGRDVEAFEESLLAVEGKGAVRLAEMEMRADLRRRTRASMCESFLGGHPATHTLMPDQTRKREQGTSEAYLDGPIPRVGHLEPDPLPPFVDPDRFLADYNRPGNFFIFEPFWFVGPFREHSLGGEGQERAVQGEREVVVDRGGADRVVDRHEKDAVREGAFDLDFVQQERDCLRRESLVESQPNVFSVFDRIADRAEHAVHMTHRLDVNPPENLLPCETGRARCQCRAACASPRGQLWACSSGERNARGRSGIAYRPASSHAIGNERPCTHSQQLYDAPPLRDRPLRRVQGDIGSSDCPVLIEGLRRTHGAGQRKDTYRWP